MAKFLREKGEQQFLNASSILAQLSETWAWTTLMFWCIYIIYTFKYSVNMMTTNKTGFVVACNHTQYVTYVDTVDL